MMLDHSSVVVVSSFVLVLLGRKPRPRKIRRHNLRTSKEEEKKKEFFMSPIFFPWKGLGGNLRIFVQLNFILNIHLL